MTAQVSDRFIFAKNEYAIIAISNPITFNLEKYGITPESTCSACWRGYWCVYNISRGRLLLQDLYVNSRDGNYPRINGVKPLSVKKNSKESFKYMRHHLYKKINLPIEYTGKILVGAGFVQEYYIHMGFQRAWAYKTLKEFVFKKGILLETIDHSKIAQKVRREIAEDPDKFQKYLYGNSLLFVEESFSTDTNTKAWWINDTR